MRKSLAVQMIARRLGVRATRLTSLVQRLADAGMIHVSSGPPYRDVTPIEVARMMLVGLVDTGLASAASTVERYGQLRGRSSTLEQGIAWALSRPDALAPTRSWLEIHTSDDTPYTVLSVVTPDGVVSSVYGDMPAVESVDRLVTVSGAALFAVAKEVSGCTPEEVDALLGSAN